LHGVKGGGLARRYIGSAEGTSDKLTDAKGTKDCPRKKERKT